MKCSNFKDNLWEKQVGGGGFLGGCDEMSFRFEKGQSLSGGEKNKKKQKRKKKKQADFDSDIFTPCWD